MNRPRLSFTESHVNHIFSRDNHECFHCQGTQTNDTNEIIIEYIIPESYGGPSMPYNAVLSHVDCMPLTLAININVKVMNSMLSHVILHNDIPPWTIPIPFEERISQTEPLDTQIYEREHHICLYCMHKTSYQNGSAKQIVSQNLKGVWSMQNAVWCCHDCSRTISVKNRMFYGLDYLQFIGAF